MPIDRAAIRARVRKAIEADLAKHARPDHHVDQERSPRGQFGGHIPTVQSDNANSFMGTPNPDSATDMESSYGYHGPSASEEEAVAEAILTEAGNDGETGELQGDFESGQQGIPQPTLWGLLSLSNRRSVKPVDGEPNIFDDVTRYINTVQGQPDTVLIDPGIVPMEQRKLAEGKLVKGDSPGHDFRGNRYTGGMGDSPKLTGWAAQYVATIRRDAKSGDPIRAKSAQEYLDRVKNAVGFIHGQNYNVIHRTGGCGSRRSSYLMPVSQETYNDVTSRGLARECAKCGYGQAELPKRP